VNFFFHGSRVATLSLSSLLVGAVVASRPPVGLIRRLRLVELLTPNVSPVDERRWWRLLCLRLLCSWVEHDRSIAHALDSSDSWAVSLLGWWEGHHMLLLLLLVLGVLAVITRRKRSRESNTTDARFRNVKRQFQN